MPSSTHPWSTPLSGSEIEALAVLANTIVETVTFVQDSCSGEFRWEPADPSPCSAAMVNTDYLRSDRETHWGSEPFNSLNADCARSVLLATDLLAGAGVLMGAGIATAATLPTLRASFERSLSVAWITNPELDPRQRYARSALERIHGYDHAIQSAPSDESRSSFKSERKDAKAKLKVFFDRVADTKESGAAKDLSVANQQLEILTARAVELAERAIHGDPVLAMYPTLSYFSHPNPIADSLWATGTPQPGGPMIRADVRFVARAAKNTMMTLGTALLQLHDWMGWPSEGLDEWNSVVVPMLMGVDELVDPSP